MGQDSVKNEAGLNESGMCAHGNFPATCSLCKSEQTLARTGTVLVERQGVRQGQDEAHKRHDELSGEIAAGVQSGMPDAELGALRKLLFENDKLEAGLVDEERHVQKKELSAAVELIADNLVLSLEKSKKEHKNWHDVVTQRIEEVREQRRELEEKQRNATELSGQEKIKIDKLIEENTELEEFFREGAEYHAERMRQIDGMIDKVNIITG